MSLAVVMRCSWVARGGMSPVTAQLVWTRKVSYSIIQSSIIRGENVSRPPYGEPFGYPRVMEDVAAAVEVCAGTPEDLTWLFHRGAQRLRTTLDAVCRQQGLSDARDWIVLTALLENPGRTQLGLSNDLGVDKTTLTALLDRLEAKQLVIRQPVPDDRRARMPAITPVGMTVQSEVAKGRDAAEAALLANFTDAERNLLRELISRIADGSCMGEIATDRCDA